MAELALHARTTDQRGRIRDMCGRLRHWGHARKYLPVVAQRAVIHDASVLHRRTGTECSEVARRVAGLAGQAGRQMVGRFSHRRDTGKGLTVVAIGATADDAGVVHFSAGESAGRRRSRNRSSMAGLAGRSRRQVVHRLGHRRYPGKHLAVMASRTSADDAGVVHYSRVIVGPVMAKRACCCGRQVIGRLGPARGNCKTRGRTVAAFAWRVAGCSVGWGDGLRFRGHAVKRDTDVIETMTGRATTDNARVLHRRVWPKATRIGIGRGMAGLARHARWQVWRRASRLRHRRHPEIALSVVATCATSDDARVIHARSRKRSEVGIGVA